MSAGELRALEMLGRVPADCRLVLVTDHANWPHLRPGEFAVIDPAPREFVSGELYLVRWSDHSEGIFEVVERPLHGPDGEATGIWFLPLNRPRTLEQAASWRGPLHLGDGPLYPAALPDKLAGLVLGIYQPAEASVSMRDARQT